jgi:RES domain-containing protein
MVTAWRIVKRKHAKSAFSGEGAQLFGGRWNNPGVPLIYTAESQSLATLEMLVHLDAPEILERYALFKIGIATSLIMDVDLAELPGNWKARASTSTCRALGDKWAGAQVSVALRVPSAIVTSEHNFLINPLHPEFSRLTIAQLPPFRFDSRLLKPRRRRA